MKVSKKDRFDTAGEAMLAFFMEKKNQKYAKPDSRMCHTTPLFALCDWLYSEDPSFDIMGFNCIKEIRRWAVEDITDDVSLDVIRGRAIELANECNEMLKMMDVQCTRRIRKMAECHAETAARNEKDENIIKDLRRKLTEIEDSRNEFSKLVAENAHLRSILKPILEFSTDPIKWTEKGDMYLKAYETIFDAQKASVIKGKE